MSNQGGTKDNETPRLIIVMGVSGTGKSTLSKNIASEFSYIFIDADDFHNEQAKRHMAENQPLTDAMRTPWIASILAHLNFLYQQDKSVVLAYSGLKKAHRQLFRELAFYCHFFYLAGDKATIAQRINQREQHFFSSTLLDSQFEALELPDKGELDIITINIERSFIQVANEMKNLAKQFMVGKNNE